MSDVYLAYLKVFIALPIVIILAYYGLRWGLHRMFVLGGRGNIKIIERAAVGSRSYLIIAEVGGKYFLLSQSDTSGINFLQELHKEEIMNLNIPAVDKENSSTSFAQILSQLREDIQGPEKLRLIKEKCARLVSWKHDK